MTIFNIISGCDYPIISALNYINFRGHILSDYKKNVKLISHKFIGLVLEIELEKKYVYLHILDCASVQNKDQNIMKDQ